MAFSSNAFSTDPTEVVEAGGGADGPARVGGRLQAGWRQVRRSVDAALDLIFPPTCLSCHGLVEDDAAGFRNVCATCRRRIVHVRDPHCTTCGYPFFGIKAENSGCPHCELLRPAYAEGRTATLLQGPVRRLIHALKYERGFHALSDIEGVVRTNSYFASFLEGAVLVPVPLHPRKRRERGYNQSELIAERLARVTGAAGVKPLLRRVVDTPTQTRLTRAARQENLKNAFALVASGSVKATERYVLVDDVFTTGATLNACAQVLRRAGVSRIDVATLGHG